MNIDKIDTKKEGVSNKKAGMAIFLIILILTFGIPITTYAAEPIPGDISADAGVDPDEVEIDEADTDDSTDLSSEDDGLTLTAVDPDQNPKTQEELQEDIEAIEEQTRVINVEAYNMAIAADDILEAIDQVLDDTSLNISLVDLFGTVTESQAQNRHNVMQNRFNETLPLLNIVDDKLDAIRDILKSEGDLSESDVETAELHENAAEKAKADIEFKMKAFLKYADDVKDNLEALVEDALLPDSLENTVSEIEEALNILRDGGSI